MRSLRVSQECGIAATLSKIRRRQPWPFLGVHALVVFRRPIGCMQAEEHPPKQSGRLRVICPAIDEDRERRINAPVHSHDQPNELVVLGVAKVLKKGRDSICEVTIEKVLYGHPATKAIQFDRGPLDPDGERRIWGLMPNDENRCANYRLNYERSPQEEKAERALARARLDYYVLSADSIVLARETATDEDHHYTVHVDRVLSGSEFKAGGSCILKLPAIRIEGHAPAVCRKPTIFFVHVASYASPNNRDQIVYRLPAEFEADVLAGSRGVSRIRSSRKSGTAIRPPIGKCCLAARSRRQFNSWARKVLPPRRWAAGDSCLTKRRLYPSLRRRSNAKCSSKERRSAASSGCCRMRSNCWAAWTGRTRIACCRLSWKSKSRFSGPILRSLPRSGDEMARGARGGVLGGRRQSLARLDCRCHG